MLFQNEISLNNICKREIFYFSEKPCNPDGDMI